jgi:uncharacterized repeat protein (TIGR04138 family)
MSIDLNEVARKAHCTPLAVRLVLDGLRFGVAEARGKGPPSIHITAKAFCEAIIDTTKANYGKDVRAKFTEAGILRSEDIGQIVSSLIEQRLCGKQAHEAISDFDGLFVTARDI